MELIVRYIGDLKALAEKIGFRAELLLGGYAIIHIEEKRAPALLAADEIIWTEVPSVVYPEENADISDSRSDHSVNSVIPGLSGAGVLVAIVDSGIDFYHPDFRNADGTTRIAALWDQGAEGTPRPPAGYQKGVCYTREEINATLMRDFIRAASEATSGNASKVSSGAASGNASKAPSGEARGVTEFDAGGHGTHVAGIAAGNGRASGGKYRGVAYESELLIVKLGSGSTEENSQTANLMTGIDFCIRYAQQARKPLALNLSYGNQNGAHNGSSLLETYLDDVALYGRNLICIGCGNDAGRRRHAGGRLQSGESTERTILVGEERNLLFSLWISALDEIRAELMSPTGEQEVLTAYEPGRGVAVKGYPAAGGRTIYPGQRAVAEAVVFVGEATPYRAVREVTVLLREPQKGRWRLNLSADTIRNGEFDVWILASPRDTRTGMQEPMEERTLTIPSTGKRPLAVAAYDATTLRSAAFSGRGYPVGGGAVKPELAAPGVNVISCAPGGGYTQKSGTSMATPYVTGCAALFLQWGPVQGNDPYLYGERLKSVLLLGTDPLPSDEYRPNPRTGYGRIRPEISFRTMKSGKTMI